MNKTNERIKIGVVVSEDGEILDDVYEHDKLVHANDYTLDHVLSFKRGAPFAKVLLNVIVPLYKELSTKEFAVAQTLMYFIDYKEGILKVDGMIADATDIANVLGENPERFRRTIHSLEEKEVLKRHPITSDKHTNLKKNCIVVNPYIYFRGKDVYRWIVELFCNSRWASY